MRLNVVVVVIGLAIAAIVGVAASLLAQPALSPTPGQTAAPGVVVAAMKSELAGLEERLNERNDDLEGEVESCAYRLNAIEQSLRELKLETGAAGGVTGPPLVVSGGEGARTGQVDAGALRDVIDAIDKEREEKKAEEKRIKKEQKLANELNKLAEAEKLVPGQLSEHVRRISREKGWDGAKSGRIEATLLEQSRKMFELYRTDLHGGSPDMGQFYEETKKLLLQELTEEELNTLAKDMQGPLGSRLRRMLRQARGRSIGPGQQSPPR